jgi:N-acetylneuraminate synthase/N,N'-diacetyllegionaminate synthase
MNKKTLIIAEAGVNHNGDLNIAYKLCKAAKEAGADIVKFQTWKTEKIITKDVAMASYQENNIEEKESQYDMLKKLELAYNDFTLIKEYCKKIGITFASTADDSDSLEFLLKLGIPFIKIGSSEITNIPYLREMGSKKMPIILSTGMSYLSDVGNAIRIIQKAGSNDISVLHCTTNYPCPYDEVNLDSMNTLKAAFKLPVGYSDHTVGIEVAIAAVAMGATIIEKHFTLDKNMEGPDHVASTDPVEFRAMVDAIRNIEKAKGDGLKKPNKSELEISEVVLKRIVASVDIREGDCFTEDNLTVMRSKNGISPLFWDSLIGKKSQKNYEKHQGIEIL